MLSKNTSQSILFTQIRVAYIYFVLLVFLNTDLYFLQSDHTESSSDEEPNPPPLEFATGLNLENI